MNRTASALREFRHIDDLAEGISFIHSLHPGVKLLTTILYIVLVMSFGKYQLAALCVMLLFPAALFALSGISAATCFYKLRIVLIPICCVGIANPFFDRAPLLYLGDIAVSGGVISMITLMLKGMLCLCASFLLIATTPMDSIAATLRRWHVPAFITTLLLLTYRYITVMLKELSLMTDAYRLRSGGQKGIMKGAWGSFLGQLLLRSMDRATELYQSMLQRGFDGSFRYLTVPAFRGSDTLFLLASFAALLIARYVNIAAWLGGLFV